MKQITLFLCFILSLGAVPSLDPLNPKWAWMDQRIEEEFSAYNKSGITLQMIEGVMNNTSRISFGGNLNRFQIIGGKVYGPQNYPKNLLEKLVKLYPVPDVDIILFNQDIIWNPWELAGPVLATCKDQHGQKVILFPIQFVAEWEEQFVL